MNSIVGRAEKIVNAARNPSYSNVEQYRKWLRLYEEIIEVLNWMRLEEQWKQGNDIY